MIQHILLKFIRIYQICISPIVPPRCRYLPTCSTYAQEAIQLYGARKGVWLSIKRIFRCHPWSGHDLYDPVPIPTNDFNTLSTKAHCAKNKCCENNKTIKKP